MLRKSLNSKLLHFNATQREKNNRKNFVTEKAVFHQVFENNILLLVFCVHLSFFFSAVFVLLHQWHCLHRDSALNQVTINSTMNLQITTSRLIFTEPCFYVVVNRSQKQSYQLTTILTFYPMIHCKTLFWTDQPQQRLHCRRGHDSCAGSPLCCFVDSIPTSRQFHHENHSRICTQDLLRLKMKSRTESMVN